jgi:hypothetical protein
MEFLKELFAFLIQRKKFWLIPAVVTLVLMAGLLVLASGSVLAPFIYSIF